MDKFVIHAGLNGTILGIGRGGCGLLPGASTARINGNSCFTRMGMAASIKCRGAHEPFDFE